MKSKVEIENKLKELVEKSIKSMLSEEDLTKYISIDGEIINVDLRLNLKFPSELYLNSWLISK